MDFLGSHCRHQGERDHPDHWPCDASVLLAETLDGQQRVYDLRSLPSQWPSGLHCQVCAIDYWVDCDMQLAEGSAYTSYGNFWRYDAAHEKVPADYCLISGQTFRDATGFQLQADRQRWPRGYSPHEEKAFFTSWKHEQIEDALLAQSAKRGVDASQLQVHVGYLYELWH